MGIATAVALTAYDTQAIYAATDIYAPLPGPADFAHLHDHLPKGPGVDMGHVAIWQLARRYYLPVWIVWQLLTGPTQT